MHAITNAAARLAFEYRMTHSTIAGDEAFPFAIATAAARNPRYDDDNLNSQDAVGICITPEFSVGVVCDGCGGTHAAFEQHSASSNEVGAKLAVKLVLGSIQASFARRRTFHPKDLVSRLEHSILRAFRSTVKAFCGHDEAKAEKFIYDFLMTTVVGFVVTEDQFLVFHSGDGVVGINGQFTVLDAEAGRYLSNALLCACCPTRFAQPASTDGMHVFASGESQQLQSILVATDGMSSLVKSCPDQLCSFVRRSPARSQCKEGFDFALEEFRRDIAWNPEIKVQMNDDASFALLRRVVTT